VQKISDSYKCKPIEGMLSHQLKQFKIDGEKTVIQNPTAAQRKEHEKCDFEKYEVYAMDVLVSSGEGQVSILFIHENLRYSLHFLFSFFFQGKEMDTKVSIYKKTEETYLLKLKASKAFYAEVCTI
jgi:methionine aminopeptidase